MSLRPGNIPPSALHLRSVEGAFYDGWHGLAISLQAHFTCAGQRVQMHSLHVRKEELT